MGEESRPISAGEFSHYTRCESETTSGYNSRQQSGYIRQVQEKLGQGSFVSRDSGSYSHYESSDDIQNSEQQSTQVWQHRSMAMGCASIVYGSHHRSIPNCIYTIVNSTHCSQCTLLTVHTAHSAHCSQHTLLTVHTAHSTHYSQHTLLTAHAGHCCYYRDRSWMYMERCILYWKSSQKYQPRQETWRKDVKNWNQKTASITQN